MSLLEIVGVFLADVFGPEAVLEAAFPAAVLVAAFLAWFFSSPVAASLVLAPAGAVCVLVGWTRGRRAEAAPQPVYLGTLPDARVLVSGCVKALVPGDTEVFLLDDGQGRALVWLPVDAEDGAGFRDGATVSLVGRAGSYERMMTELATRGAGVAPALMRSLQSPDLRGLPCFWAGADPGVRAAETSAEAMMAGSQDPGGTLRAAGAALMVFAAVLFLGRVFRVL